MIPISPRRSCNMSLVLIPDLPWLPFITVSRRCNNTCISNLNHYHNKESSLPLMLFIFIYNFNINILMVITLSQHQPWKGT